MTNTAYARVKEAYDKKRQRAIEQSDSRRAALHETSSELRVLDEALSKTGLKLFRIAIDGGKDALAEAVSAVRVENERLLTRRAEILASLGYPADYTEVHYECEHCKDTGYLDTTEMCPCMKRALAEEGFRASGLGELIDLQSFDNFTLDYYKKDENAYEWMRQNLQFLRRFAENFTPRRDSFLLIGGTGLGKTHLSTAIARCVIERGYDVRYDSVSNVFSDLEYDKFKSRGDEARRGDKYLDCDLLILDDLGTEISTQFTVSALYNLVNTRLNRGKSTIISTNLSHSELLSRYDERLTSRFFGEYTVLQFKGTDVRMQKR